MYGIIRFGAWYLLDVLITASLSPSVKEWVEQEVRSGGGVPTFEADHTNASQEVEVIFGNVSVDDLLKYRHVRWLQTVSAGVDRFAAEAERLPEDLVITNGSTVYGPAGGDHVMAMMLYFTRSLGYFARKQAEGVWDPSPLREGAVTRLLGQRLVVLGLGDLGTNVARRAKAFGMHVIGVKRTLTPSDVADEVVTIDELDRVLPDADHVAITLPLTKATHGLLDRRRLALMKPTAYVYNIGRGAIIDEEALVDALQSGRLAGAGLDVFVKEPLPKDHPFWTMENVLITPHVGANTRHDHDIAAELFVENWHRFRAGEPLANVVDLRLGY